MRRRASIAVALPCLLLLGADPVYGPKQRFEGVYTSSFEHSEFGGCWLSFSEAASRKFWSLIPREKYEGHRYRVAFMGRSTPRIADVGRGGGYGHMGMMPCEIEVLEVLDAKHLGVIKP
jgi:hypothetical protein